MTDAVAEIETETQTIVNHPTYTWGYMGLDGSVIASSSYAYTNRISVNVGDIITAGTAGASSMKVVTAFSNNTADSTKGAENTSSYTVPSGVDEIVVTGNTNFYTYSYEINVTMDVEVYHQKVDATLEQSGIAADAKATGDAIRYIYGAFADENDTWMEGLIWNL